MRILVCAVEAPCPPPNGLRVVIAALTGELATRHNVLTIAFPAADQQRVAPRPGLQLVAPPARSLLRQAWRFAGAGLHRRPLSADALHAAMRPALRRALADFRPDVVHVTNGKLAGVVDDLGGIPAVVAPLDAWHRGVEAAGLASRGLRRWMLRLERRNVARFEARTYPRFDGVVVVSDAERDALLALDQRMRIHVIPNGVDTDRFRPDPAAAVHRRIVFTGVMRWGPNVAAAQTLAREVLPLVRDQMPDVTLALVGRDPSPAVQGLGALPGVEVVGEVADMREWLVTSAVFACPATLDLGIKNKLLEAMACGVPCVVAPSALGGLRAVPGRDLVVAATSVELADEIVSVVHDRDRARSLGAAGRAYVVDAHGWPRAAAAYEAVYADAVASRVKP